jgi:NAD(P)-dependent dehydrogenase (short-subunit alcohol dehydrogenase family)
VRTRSWSAQDIGDLSGTARALAGHGAHVVLACRNEEKAQRAAEEMARGLDHASLERLPLDLSDLVSVRRAAEQFLSVHDRLDLLVNNAGVMGAPYRQTADGFELQMATNHLGHFALTGLLLPRLLESGASRVVTVSSLMHRSGRIPFDDVAGTVIRNTWLNYGTSKLANLLFTAELSRRLTASASPTMSVAAHPGWTRSNLAGTGAAVGENRIRAAVGRTVGHIFGQSAAMGSLPSLYAATAPGVRPGDYIGPRYLFELAGPPKVVKPNKRARSADDARQLWEISEELTEVGYPSAAAG